MREIIHHFFVYFGFPKFGEGSESSKKAKG